MALMRNGFGGHPFGNDEYIAEERKTSRKRKDLTTVESQWHFYLPYCSVVWTVHKEHALARLTTYTIVS